MKNIKIVLGTSCLILASASAQSAQVFATDVIVQGSECVGVDCNSAESFGFDTLRLKENNLRLHFDDTSNSASFPGNDWRIVINDSANGGANYFAIEDSTAGRKIVTVEAGAPANSLYVESTGDVGVGTSAPVVEFHVVDGDSPTLRLEQNGSSGFTAQTWDIAGNETNFFVRDVTGGSKLPFKIKPGAPDNSLFVSASGQIGVGTASPSDDIHIQRSSPARIKLSNSGIVNSATVDQNWVINSNGTFRISAGSDAAEFTLNADAQLGLGTGDPQDDLHIVDAGPARIRLTNTTKSATASEDPDWSFNSNGTLRISAGSDAAELKLTADGDLTVTGGYFVNATELSVPDYVFEPEYELKSIEEQADYMFSNKHLPSVKAAPKPEEQLNLVDQQLGILEELEKAHIYISLLHNRIKTLEGENNDIVASLESRLQKLEASTNNAN